MDEPIRFHEQGAMLITEIKPHPKNPRKHSEEELSLLEKNIAAHGFASTIVVQKSTNRIIAGHARYEVLKRKGHEGPVPVVLVECSDEAANALMIADNQLTAMGRWDYDLLKDIASGLKEINYDMDLTALSDMDLRSLAPDPGSFIKAMGGAPPPPEEDPDEPPEIEDESQVADPGEEDGDQEKEDDGTDREGQRGSIICPKCGHQF